MNINPDDLSFESTETLEKQLNLAIQNGDKQEEANALKNLGLACAFAKRFDKAKKWFEQSLTLAIEIGDRNSEMDRLDNLCDVNCALDRYDRAIIHCQLLVDILVEKGDKWREAVVYAKMGVLYEEACNYDEAFRHFQMSLDIFKKLGVREGEVEAYRKLGILCINLLGKYEEGIEYLQKCIAIDSEMGNEGSLGIACGAIGVAYQSLGKYHCSFEYLRRYLDIFIELGDKGQEAIASRHLGSVCQSLGEYETSLNYYETALSICLELEEKEGEGKAYSDIGVVYSLQGKYQEAIRHYEKCLNIALKLGNRTDEMECYGRLGNAYHSLGKYSKSIEFQEKAFGLALELGEKTGLAAACTNLGNEYQTLGKTLESVSLYERGIAAAVQLNDRKLEAGLNLNLGTSLHQVGQNSDAIEYFEKSLNIASEMGDRHLEGEACGNLGRIYSILGKTELAVEFIEKSLSIARDIGDRSGEARVCVSFGQTYEATGNYDKARDYYEKSLTITSQLHDKALEGSTHYNIGRLYKNKHGKDSIGDEQYGKAKEHFEKSVQCYDELFDNLESLEDEDEFKISIFDQFVHAYKALSDVFIETNQTNEALLVCERGRARALEELLTKKYNIVNSTTQPASNSRLNLNDFQTSLQPDSSVLFFDVPILQRSIHTWALSHLTAGFTNNELKTEQPCESFENEIESESIADVVEKSYHNIHVREGMVCEDRSVEIPGDVGVEETRTSRSSPSSEEVVSSKRCVYDEDDVENPLEALYETLVTQLERNLTQNELVIIPDGILFMVPFAALKNPITGKFLSETKRIRLVPSLTTLKILNDSPQRHYKSRALIVGNPDIGKVRYKGKETSFPSLPAAELEATEIAKLLKVKPLLGAKATKEAVLDMLGSGVSIIHFAAHGSTNGEIILAPLLSQGGRLIPREKDYVLTVADAQLSGLNAQLVVLSCCHSGRGEIRSEGVVGMTRAFLAAGARAVVASLWAIDDNATMVFMLKFYSYLKNGESACKSLQETMKEMRETERYKEPKFWAGFFLIGDDVTITTFKKRRRPKLNHSDKCVIC